MRRPLIAIALAVSLTAAACGGSGGSEEDSATNSTGSTEAGATAGAYVGSDGVEADISDTSRIVSLNGDITETIFALGAGDRVVARDLTTTYPPEAEALPDVGLYRTLTAEPVM